VTRRSLHRRIPSPIAARTRFACERGFSLTEVLVVSLILIFVLSAILGIVTSTTKLAKGDQERSDTLASADIGLGRMATELREACYIVPPGTTPVSGRYCGTSGLAPAATGCASSANCIDFIMLTRTTVTRTGGSCATTPCVARATVRVRYDCAVSDPAANGTTRCVRYEGGSCATTAACDSPPATPRSDLVRSVLNSVDAARPVFRYCTGTDAFTATGNRLACTASPGTATALGVSVYVARSGELKTGAGMRNGMFLQRGVGLPNIGQDATA
jgi:type II secretory pathway pseudopilin PulG